MRNKATNMDDFPLPVRPQMPIFWPGKTVKEILFNTIGKFSRYFMLKSTISSLPLAGQFSGIPVATSGSVEWFFSNGKSKYWTTRSTAFICVSSCEAMFVPCSMYFVTSKAYTKVKPAMPASTFPWITKKDANKTMPVPINRKRIFNQHAAMRCEMKASAFFWAFKSASKMKCACALYALIVSTPKTASPNPL